MAARRKCKRCELEGHRQDNKNCPLYGQESSSSSSSSSSSTAANFGTENANSRRRDEDNDNSGDELSGDEGEPEGSFNMFGAPVDGGGMALDAVYAEDDDEDAAPDDSNLPDEPIDWAPVDVEEASNENVSLRGKTSEKKKSMISPFIGSKTKAINVPAGASSPLDFPSFLLR